MYNTESDGNDNDRSIWCITPKKKENTKRTFILSEIRIFRGVRSATRRGREKKGNNYEAVFNAYDQMIK